MRTFTGNPPNNMLPTGMAATTLVQAIVESGFPLQGRVAHELSSEFVVIEEWGFIDDESGDHRTLDIYAHCDLGETQHEVAPSLVLLVECKRSRNPYVFFQTAGIRQIASFPSVSGMRSWNIDVSERGRGRSTSRHASTVLCLDELPFVATGPAVCGAFSQAVPKKDFVELTGSDPFNRVILPLVKALRHAQAMLTITTNQELIFPTVVIAICVLEAPMILVENPTAAVDPVLTPWVRVARREAVKDKSGHLRNRFFAVDFVHAAFLQHFVRDHVRPFADEFARRAVLLGDGLRHGVTVPSLEAWTFEDVQAKTRRV